MQTSLSNSHVTGPPYQPFPLYVFTTNGDDNVVSPVTALLFHSIYAWFTSCIYIGYIITSNEFTGLSLLEPSLYVGHSQICHENHYAYVCYRDVRYRSLALSPFFGFFFQTDSIDKTVQCEVHPQPDKKKEQWKTKINFIVNDYEVYNIITRRKNWFSFFPG